MQGDLEEAEVEEATKLEFSVKDKVGKNIMKQLFSVNLGLRIKLKRHAILPK